MPIPFTCPHCGQLLRVSNRKVGQAVQCVRCHGGVIVPPPLVDPPGHEAASSPPAEVAPPAQSPAPPKRARATVAVTRGALYSIGGLLMGASIVSFLLGWAMGREAAVDQTISSANATQYVRGQLSYLTQRGRAVGDSEAVVLAIPVARKPDEKFAIDVLRPEVAPPGPHHPVVQGIRSLGGDFTRTGPNGQYELQLPAPGSYFLLMISNHTGRPAERPPTTTEIVEIGQYFKQATDLLGANDYVWSKQLIQADRTINHQFGQP